MLPYHLLLDQYQQYGQETPGIKKINTDAVPKETNSLKLQTDEQCADAWKKCFENAERHRDAALRVAGPKTYGTAITLLILGTEEYVKGILYWLQSNHINIRHAKGVQLFFTDHIVRHTFASTISMTFDICRELLDMVYKLRDQLHDQTQPDWTAFQSAAIGKDEEKMEGLLTPMLTLMGWWEKANDQKNDGLYVGTTNKPGELLTPDTITQEQYEYGVEVVKEFAKKLHRIIDYVTGLNEDQKRSFIDIANTGGIVILIEKITAGRKEQKKRKQQSQSVIEDILKLNRGDH